MGPYVKNSAVKDSTAPAAESAAAEEDATADRRPAARFLLAKRAFVTRDQSWPVVICRARPYIPADLGWRSETGPLAAIAARSARRLLLSGVAAAISVSLLLIGAECVSRGQETRGEDRRT